MATILIPPPRIPLIDQRTGMMAQAWYSFFSQFLQGLSDDGTSTTVDLTALTSRVLAAENGIDALEAEDGNLFVDAAMDVGHTAEIDELRKRIADLEADFRPDPTAALNALHDRIADLELQISMMTGNDAALDELRRRVSGLEIDVEMNR
jgi:hypothetical protein